MMKNIYLLLIVICFPFFSFSQETYRDSLKLNLTEQEDGKSFLYELISSEKLDYRLAVINNQLGLTYQYESNLDLIFFC